MMLVIAHHLQVAFSLTIPAMLLASTTKTLTNTQSSNLIALPIIAVVQIAIGAAFGRWAAAAVEGRLWLTRVLLGWGDLNPTPAAAAIAASTAAALRAPMVRVGCRLHSSAVAHRVSPLHYLNGT